MNKLHVKTGDTVVVISGKDKGTVGKVIAAAPEEGKVMVEKVNMVSKHMKARKQGDVSSIIKAEGAIYASKVALWCDACKQGVRVKHVVKDGKKIRVCAKCGKEL